MNVPAVPAINTLPNPFGGFVAAAPQAPPKLIEPADALAEAQGVLDRERPPYIPEHFSDYAMRRSMPIISPPRNVDRVCLKAVEAALNLHPRDLDDDPPPLFLRKPSPAFLEALFDLAGVHR